MNHSGEAGAAKVLEGADVDVIDIDSEMVPNLSGQRRNKKFAIEQKNILLTLTKALLVEDRPHCCRLAK